MSGWTEERREQARQRMNKVREVRMQNLAKRKEEEEIILKATPLNGITGEKNLPERDNVVELQTNLNEPEIVENSPEIAQNESISNRGTTHTEPAGELKNEKMGSSTSQSENLMSQNVKNDINKDTVTLTNEQFQQLLQAFQANQGVQLPKSNSSEIVERVSINPNAYNDPTEFLYNIPELKRFNLRENFVIKYNFSTIKYQTAQGAWYIEPNFEVQLMRKQFDPVTGEELIKKKPDGTTYKPRIILGKAIFFEDAPANIEEAQLAGLSVDDIDKDDFAEKMRFWRMKEYIISRVNPRPVITKTSRMREEVIGGKVYQIDEYSDFVE